MASTQLLGGRYRLVDRLAEGGMAVVWRARDEVLGRRVAVKVLAGRYAADPQWRARIRAEARAAATSVAPQHRAGARLRRVGRAAGAPVPYVVMELLPGRTLAAADVGRRLPVTAAVSAICGAGGGGARRSAR